MLRIASAPAPALLLLAALTSLASLGAGCADPTPGADCDTAARHVTDCYGAEIGEAFAASCSADPAAAETALAETCQSGEDGKADSAATPILSPPVEHFKYGSIGADKLGLPASLVRAMPLVCADLLPAGADPRRQPLAAFGFNYEPGRDLPIGFSSRRLPLIGITLTGTTCSACHTSTVRETPTSPRQLYFGAPNIRFDVERYNEFLFDCIGDTTRFSPANLDRAFRELGIGGTDRLLALSPSLLRAFVSGLRTQVNSVVRDGAWGPGRDDAIGLSAAILLGEQFLPAVPAPVDYPSVWNQAARRGRALHWDGAAGTARERNVLVSVGAGTPKDSVPLASIDAIQRWLEDLPAPRYPFAIDAARAAQGAQVFQSQCADCHAAGGARLFQAIPIAELGTDPNRLTAVSQAGLDRMNSLSGAGWTFDSFRRTGGYMAGPLDGIWLRAPYLHNGSVPTLRDLLSPEAARPAAFYRGNDTYDQAAVGFISTVPAEGSASYVKIETARSGSSNRGHVYGTTLPAADREALLEYLKTL